LLLADTAGDGRQVRPVREVADPPSAMVDTSTITVAMSPKANRLVLFKRNRKPPSEPPPRFFVFDVIEFLVATATSTVAFLFVPGSILVVVANFYTRPSSTNRLQCFSKHQ
jgi:hypothetical protein